jgi:penicillin-binding protein 1A
VAQCALLAGIPRSPTYYDPLTSPDAATARRRDVLRLMQKDGYITVAQERLADQEPLALATGGSGLQAPHFVYYVISQIEQTYGRDALEPRRSFAST